MKKAKVLKNKQFKKIIAHIEAHIGDFATGMLVAILADSLDHLCADGQDHSIRNMEIIYNDFFSYKKEFSDIGNEE